MEEYRVQEDIQIAMASYHTLKDCPQNSLPLGPRTRTSLVPLFSESRQIRIGSTLEKGDREKMRRLPEGLAVTILEVIILSEQNLEPPTTLEGYWIDPLLLNFQVRRSYNRLIWVNVINWADQAEAGGQLDLPDTGKINSAGFEK